MAERNPRLAGSAFETNSTSRVGSVEKNLTLRWWRTWTQILAAITAMWWESFTVYVLFSRALKRFVTDEAPGSSFYIIPCCFQGPSEISNPYHNREKTVRRCDWSVQHVWFLNPVTQWQIRPLNVFIHLFASTKPQSLNLGHGRSAWTQHQWHLRRTCAWSGHSHSLTRHLKPSAGEDSTHKI